MERASDMGMMAEGKLVDYSTSTIRKVCEQLAAVIALHPERGIRILECGGGSGNVTEHLLRDMRPEDQIISIELVEELSAESKERFRDEPRVTVLHQNFLEFHSEEPFDLILVMIPTNPFWVPLGELWKKALSLCQPEARLITLPYICNPVGVMARMSKNHKALAEWLVYLEIMKKHRFSKRLNFWNVPPCWVVTLSAQPTQKSS